MFSSLFLHAGWVHLIGNMWFLWVFGEALEDDLGHGRFLGFYLFCGFFACIFHVLAASSLAAPLIGASGAIAGVLGGYLVRLPKSSILHRGLLAAAPGDGVYSRLYLAGALAGAAVLRPQERRPRGLDGSPGGLRNRDDHGQPVYPPDPGAGPRQNGPQRQSRPQKAGES